MKKLLCGLVGVAGLAGSVSAQGVNWTTNFQFRNRVAGVDQAPLAGNTLALSATGVYTFSVQVGIFNVTGLGSGQANFGLNNWTSNLTSTGLNSGGLTGETLGVVQTNARVSPFVFGPATSFGGTLTAGGTAISNVNAARDVSGGAQSPWLWDSVGGVPAAQPTLPTNPSPGSEAFVTVWRFSVVVSSFNSGSPIVINFAGQAGPVLQWATFGTNPPDAENVGSVNFLGLTPTPVLRDYSPTQLTLTRIPAPGAMALLSLGGLVALRRRR